MLPKGPLYYTKFTTYNIIFEHGNDPPSHRPRLNNVKKTALFLHDGFPKYIKGMGMSRFSNSDFALSILKVVWRQKFYMINNVNLIS